MERRPALKPLFWIGSSRRDLKGFPAEVQNAMAVRRGIATPQADMNVIRTRLETARQHHIEWRSRS